MPVEEGTKGWQRPRWWKPFWPRRSLTRRPAWSLGTFGAIAEFVRDADEPAAMGRGDLAIATGRGAIRLRPPSSLRLVASEGATKDGWSQRVALCLPEDRCAMNRRRVLTEVGPDTDAIREADRNGILFDLGFDVVQATSASAHRTRI